MTQTIAIDIYGTIINTSGVYQSLRQVVTGDAKLFMKTWRDKQLEYSFRRGLMNKHVDFSVVTKQALDYSCTETGTALSKDEKKSLLDEYKNLPAFPDVEKSLKALHKLNHHIYAFSNGSKGAVSKLLENSGLSDLFNGIISTEDVEMFKPSPLVYDYFIRETGADVTHAWLISGNSFDVIGALSFGMKAVWVKRSPQNIYDPWEIEPTGVIQSLTELSNLIE